MRPMRDRLPEQAYAERLWQSHTLNPVNPSMLVQPPALAF